MNIIRFVVTIHFLPFMFCCISRCLNGCYQCCRSKSILLSAILRGGFIPICLQDSIRLELLDSRHVYKSLLFEHLYALGVLELFGYHIRLLKDAWQMNVWMYDNWFSHFHWMPFSMEKDKTFDPSNIRFFGSSTIVKSLNFLTNEIKKPRFLASWFRIMIHFTSYQFN